MEENKQNLSQAVDQAMAKLGDFPDDISSENLPSQELPASSETKVEEPVASAPSETKEVAKAEATKAEQKPDEGHLPEELRTPLEVAGEEQLKRIRGFQASYTKRMQNVESEVRAEYEKKFQEVLARMPGQGVQVNQPTAAPKQSLADFFPQAPKEQLEPLDQAIKEIIRSQIAPIEQENKTLKQFVNQAQANQTLQQQYLEAQQSHPDITNRMQDLVAWGHTNPEVARGKSVKEMYQLMTYEEQFRRGRDAALSELKKKEKESLETDSIPNTVTSALPKSIWDAARLADQQLQAKYRK